MSDSIVVSVPHSGTRFLKERLGVDEHVHSHRPWKDVLKRIEGKHVYVPLRNPKMVWHSWCRRNNKDPLWFAPEFFAAWFNIHTLDQVFDLDFICLDKQNDARIKDWGRVGGNDASRLGHEIYSVDMQPIYKLPYINRYYPVWSK